MKSSIFMENKKGFSIMTAILLVIVFVSVLLLLIYLNYKNALEVEKLLKLPYFLQRTTTLRKEIVNCLNISEKEDLSQMFNDLNKCLPKQVKGYFIERLTLYECNYARLQEEI